jgi:hypothetical protein
MSGWQVTLALALGGGAVGLIYNIFLEVRSIRRMMNTDRRISNEVREFDD